MVIVSLLFTAVGREIFVNVKKTVQIPHPACGMAL